MSRSGGHDGGGGSNNETTAMMNTTNFETASLFSFSSVDSSNDDDQSTITTNNNNNNSRLSYLTVLSELLASPPIVSQTETMRCRKLTSARLGKLIDCHVREQEKKLDRNCQSLDQLVSQPVRIRSRYRISGGDSISLADAQSRPSTTCGRNGGMKRCVSAKIGLNEIGKYNESLSPVSNNLKHHENKPDTTVVMMKDVIKQSGGRVATRNEHEQLVRSPPSLSLTNVTVDTSKAKSNSDVIRLCLTELGWQECPKGGFGCDIIWQSCATSHEGRDSINSTPNNVSSLTSTQSSFPTRVNKFPCMNQLLRKGPLTQSLNTMRLLFDTEYDFYPKTWFLPEQLKEFAEESKYMHERQCKANKPRTIFIVKPNDGSQGDGIYLIDSVDEYLKRATLTRSGSSTSANGGDNQRTCARPHANHHKMHIVQEYIHNPYLIDGLKFDLRIYVVILSLKPLQIYLYDEGLVRFATVNYQAPDEKNLDQIYMHLTNYSLNKKNDMYKFTSKIVDDAQSSSANDTNSQGSKRKLSKVFEYMSKKGVNVMKIKNNIDDLVVKTVIALLPEMKVESGFEMVNSPNKPRASCFQIIGFDILIRDDFKPMLLEVNCNPSLRIDYEIETADGSVLSVLSPIDLEIKKPLVLETLKLVAPPKKLEIMQRIKREEQQKEKEMKAREQLVRQRIEQRLLSAKKIRTLDIEKCPLLSKPSGLYLKNKVKPKLTLQSKDENSLMNIDSNTSSKNSFSSDATKSRSSLNTINDKNVSCKDTSNKSVRNFLRAIYSQQANTKSLKTYERLKLLEHVADIFMCFTMFVRSKFMSHLGFRSFIKQCNLIGEALSADNLDVIFFDLIKKWEFYNKKKTEYKGLCFQGFVECFFKLSVLMFDDAATDVESVKNLIYYCKFFLKLRDSKINSYFSTELNHDTAMSDFKPSAKLSTLLNTRIDGSMKNITNVETKNNGIAQRSTSVLSNNGNLNPSFNNNLVNGTNNSRLEKYKLDEKKSLFPIFF